jgi:hypothetical protein
MDRINFIPWRRMHSLVRHFSVLTIKRMLAEVIEDEGLRANASSLDHINLMLWKRTHSLVRRLSASTIQRVLPVIVLGSHALGKYKNAQPRSRPF